MPRVAKGCARLHRYSAEMSIDPTIEEQELLADSFRRPNTHMAKSELVAGVLGSSAFAAAVAAVWVLRPPHAFAILPAVVCSLVLLLAMLIVFETPFGFTDATQLGFVPLLFAMPLAFVPIAMALAQAVSWVPSLRSGELRPEPAVDASGNTFFAFGAVVVLAMAQRRTPQCRRRPCCSPRSRAQFLVDFIVSTLRFTIVRGARFSSVLTMTWVYAIDAALSGDRAGRRRGHPHGPDRRAGACPAARAARGVCPRAPQAAAEHARAQQRLSRHRARARRRHRGRRRLHRRALQERRQPRARPRRTARG